MKLQRIVTEDNSHTFFVPELNEYYHSIFGAIQESYHIFIKNGLHQKRDSKLSIMEVGFGTGLNCLLTLLECHKLKKKIFYTALEIEPIDINEVLSLNYSEILEIKKTQYFEKIHKAMWNHKIQITDLFFLQKINTNVLNFKIDDQYDLIFFDLFTPNIQPQLWTYEVFRKIYNAMNINGLLLTFSSKGIVKKALRDVGFEVKRLKGPKGKKHILCAKKIIK